MRDLRGSESRSARELRRHSGISQGYLSQLETVKKNLPTNDVLKKTAADPNVEYEHILYFPGIIDKTLYKKREEIRNEIDVSRSMIGDHRQKID